jgi:uncharacterized BrkB/YihY/UPF0761 family membrane protein
MSAHHSEPRAQLEKLPPPRPTLLHRLTAWIERAHAVPDRVEKARRRSGTLDAALETIETDSEIGGGMLAGALSYRLFVFALPLAFFLASALGLLANAVNRNPNLLADSVGLAGVITEQVSASASSNWWVALSSLLVLLYATRVLLRAVAIVHALAWERSAAAVKVSGRSVAVFGATVICQLGLVAAVGAVNHQTAIGVAVAVVLFAFALGALWLVVSLRVPHGNARWTDLIPGSLFYACGVFLVVLFNILILDRLLEEKASTYGALGIAATLLLGFFLIGRVIVGAAVLNATLYKRRQRPQDDEGAHNGQHGRGRS